MCAVRADTEPRAEVLPQGPEARPGRRAAAGAPAPPVHHDGAAELGGREQRGRRAVAARGAPQRAGRRARSVRRRCSRLHRLEQPRRSPCRRQQWQVPLSTVKSALELHDSGSGLLNVDLTMFQDVFLQRCDAWTGQAFQLQGFQRG
jgi:hypothetical protein